MLYARIRAGAARPVGDQQVVPALAEDHDRRFGVDGDVDRLSLGIQTLPGLRIQLDEADVAEVGTVREPERPGRGIEKHARVDGIAVLDAIGPDDRTAVLPFVVRGVRIERPADQKADRRFWLRARRGIVEEVLLTDPNHVRRPGIVAATRDDVRAGTPARQRLHQGAGPPPRPSVIRDQHGQTGPGPVRVVPAAVHHHGRRIVDSGLPIECHDGRDEQQHGGKSGKAIHRVTASPFRTIVSCRRTASRSPESGRPRGSCACLSRSRNHG